MKMNESLAQKCKAASSNAFIKIGNMAVGNKPDNDSKRGNIDVVPFSWIPSWAYETPAPKRKSK